MNIYFVDTLIKLISINLCISFSFFKIINHTSSNNFEKLFIISISVILAYIQSISQNIIPVILRIFFVYFSYSFILGKLCKIRLGYSLIATLLSLSISYIASAISCIVIAFIFVFFTGIKYTSVIVLLFVSLLTFILVYCFFRIKRFKYGFVFIKDKSNNDYLDIFVLIINTIIIFMYFFIGNYANISVQHLILCFIFFTIIMFIITQKTFILYQKQKLLTQTIKDYETELQETKSKLDTALAEKYKLVKTNHEFYHRQEALKQKLNNLVNLDQNNNLNCEIAEEYGDILDRINTLSEEYASKIKPHPVLDKTHIPEIDDMFDYMQSECEKYDIEFILKINSDINHMIENVIPKSRLETLIGDLLRNAIIAINHSTNKYRSIMAILGVKDNCFEFCVYDSGIEFEINTLLKLGTEAITTHESDGGTGIGFVTTFETLNYCNASLIINEISPKSGTYTKSIVIRFDNNHLYTINSYRADDFNNLNSSKRNIVINKIDN